MNTSRSEIRYDEVRTGAATLECHAHMQHGHLYIYRSAVEPRLSMSVFRPKPHHAAKHPPYRRYAVEGWKSIFETLQDALGAIEHDERKKDDDAWDAAAPKKAKPCEIPNMLPPEQNK